MARIGVRVTDAQKDRWKQAAEDSSEYDSLTHLIQLAVSKELADDAEVHPVEVSADAPMSGDTLREIQGTTERVEDGMTDVKARLRSLEERVGETGADISLKSAVRETLPEPPELEPGTPDNPSVYGLTAEQVAARLDGDTDDVQEALTSLSKESSEVTGRTGGEPVETYYFRQGGA